MRTSTWWVGLVITLAALSARASEPCRWPAAMPSPAVVLVGEIHGTDQAPAFVGQLACAASADGTAVTVALEISAQEQPRLDAYLASAGTPAARAAVLAGPFWTRSTQDGRSSTAMLALLERLRRLNADGRRVAVIAVDEERIGARDVGMAEQITRAVQPGRRVIALLGNVHASQRLGRPNLPDYAPAGYLLRALAPLGVRVGAHGGEAWVCAPVCGYARLASSAWAARRSGMPLATVRSRGMTVITPCLCIPRRCPPLGRSCRRPGRARRYGKAEAAAQGPARGVSGSWLRSVPATCPWFPAARTRRSGSTAVCTLPRRRTCWRSRGGPRWAGRSRRSRWTRTG